MNRYIVIGLLLCCAGCMTKKQFEEKKFEDRMSYLHKYEDEIPDHIHECILTDRICIGMTVNQVMLAWYYDINYTSSYWTQPYKHSSGRTMLELRSQGQIRYTLYFDEDGKLEEWFEWNP